MYFTRAPWETLRPGQRLSFTSYTGKQYQVTVVCHGRGSAGLYVRLPSGKLGRIEPQRVDWRTVEHLGDGPTTATGDSVIVFAEGEERRGRLAAPLGAGVHVELERGAFCSFPMSETIEPRFRLRFHTR